ncbi:MAG: YcaO-like family protein, partial [Chloroflexi bacterium]|nr:YcaO-like family protein [Chloroflexota bacterium]
ALSLLDSYARARVDVVVADCTIDTGVATYWAVIRDRAEPGIGVFGGYGTHADPGVALCRALNEAAQGRLVFISGSRDDIFKRDMISVRRRDNPWTRHFLESSPVSIDFDSAPRISSPTFDADISEILRRLRAVGLEQAIVCDLTEPTLPVAIVRVVVPGLEGYMTGLFRPGKRARQFVAGCKV